MRRNFLLIVLLTVLTSMNAVSGEMGVPLQDYMLLAQDPGSIDVQGLKVVPKSSIQIKGSKELNEGARQTTQRLKQYVKSQDALLSALQRKIKEFEALHRKANVENRAYAARYETCKRKTFDDFAPNHVRRVCGTRPTDTRRAGQWTLTCLGTLRDQCAGEGNEYPQTLAKLKSKGDEVKNQIDAYIRGTKKHIDGMSFRWR